MTFIFHAYENRIDVAEIQLEGEKTVGELYDRLADEMDFEYELDYHPKIQNLVIVLNKQPTKRVQPEQSLSELLQSSSSETVELMVVYPSEPGGALIQFCIEGEECYFQNIVNKNDPLQNYIQILLKKLAIEQEVQIKVNGKLSSLDNPIEKKLIKKLISGRSERVFVEISKVQSRKIEQKLAQERAIKEKQRVQVAKEDKVPQQQPSQKLELVNAQAGVGKLNLQNHKAVQDRKKPQVIQQKQIMQQLPPQKSKQGNQKVLPEREQIYTFLISFDTDNGKRVQSLDVRPGNTMLEVLPTILEQIQKAGFDWDLAWKDQFLDKLAITYGEQRVQFNKLNKKFYQILGPCSEAQKFEIKRRYAGG